MESFPRGGIEYDNNNDDKKKNKRVNDNDDKDALFGSKRTKRIEVVASKSSKKGIDSSYISYNVVLILNIYLIIL